jgi:hypothetical protein
MTLQVKRVNVVREDWDVSSTPNTVVTIGATGNLEASPLSAVNPTVDFGLTENPPTELNTTSYDAFPQLYQLPSGKLVMFHKQGVSHEGEGDGVMRTSTDQGKTWSNPVVVLTEPGKYVGLSGGEVTPTGRIVQFYFIATIGVGTDEIGYIYSDDEGVTWSDRITIPMGSNNGGGPTGKMLSIADGKLMQCWFGYDGPYNTAGTVYTLYAIFSADNGATWGSQVTIATGMTDTNTAWTECSFVYLEGSNLVGLVRRDTASYYRQFKSEDNGATWTNQGDATFDFFDYQSAPELAKFTDLDGKKTVVAYWANRSPDLKLRAIYGRNLLSGVSGWDASTRTDIATLLNDDSGYPSVLHPNGSIYGLGTYYQGKTASDSDIQFFKYPLLEAKISDTVIWDAKIGGSGTTNALSKFTAGGVLGNSQITDNGSTVNVNNPSNVYSRFSVRDGVDLGVYVKSGQDNPVAVMFNFANDALSANIPAEFRATAFNFAAGNVKVIAAVDPEDAIQKGQVDALDADNVKKSVGGTQVVDGNIALTGGLSATTSLNGASVSSSGNITAGETITGADVASGSQVVIGSSAPTLAQHATRMDYVDPVNIVNGTGTLALATTNKQMYYTFTGSTSTWTLPVVSGNTFLRYTLINAGSGNITLNSNSGGNDILDAGVAVNTKNIASGAVVVLYDNGTNFVVIP